MRYHIFGRMTLASALALAAAVPLEAQQPSGRPDAAETVSASLYVHPQKKYALVIPPKAQAMPDQGGADITIRSREGYMVKVQSARTNRQIPLERMAGKLEAVYLGEGKPWSAKLSQKSGRLGRFPTYDALYEGSNSRSRVVIARGAQFDYVFMFFSPPAQYLQLVREFDWMLANFKPPGGAPELAKRPPPKTPPQSPPIGNADAPGRPLEQGTRRFVEPGYGFSIDYPSDWVVEKPSPHRLVFSGRPGEEAYVAMISVENVLPPKAADGSQAVASVLNDIKQGLSDAARDVRYFGEGPFVYARDGARLEGRKFLATYSHNGVKFRKWTMIVPRPRGNVAHVWHYTAPEAAFEAYRPMAEGMLKSWALDLGAPVGRP